MAFHCLGRPGNGEHPRFHGPLCYQRSVRLFLRDVLLIPSKQAFPNNDAGISIGVAMHLALWATHEGRTRSVSFVGFPCIITSNQAPTTSTVTAGISRTHPTRHDPDLPRFVFAVLEDFPRSQYERFSLPLRLYLPFCGLKCPRCSNTRMLA